MTSSRFLLAAKILIAITFCMCFAGVAGSQNQKTGSPDQSSASQTKSSGYEQVQSTELTADVLKGPRRKITVEPLKRAVLGTPGITPGMQFRISTPQPENTEDVDAPTVEPADEPAEIVEVISAEKDGRSFLANLRYDHLKGDRVEVVGPCYLHPTPQGQEHSANSGRGFINVGCPKVWRSERIFTVLDGMLRDVDSITLKALQDLDPNGANLAQIVSVVNDLQVKAQFNQATGINNALKMQQIKVNRGAELQNAQAAQKANQALIDRRDLLSQESVELQKQELESVKKGGADLAKNSELKAIQAQETTVQKQLGDINTALAKPQVGDASLPSDQGPTLTAPTTGNALANLPDSFSKALQSALQQPTLPASMRMDNVVELLHQRLTREFGVMYDDLSRQATAYNVYLLQFDIGVLPQHGAKDREALVNFEFTDPSVLAYELYPGMSNYNIMRGMDKTSRIGISGLAQSIIGFGLAASFNHERHELQSGLSQSLFVSGYGAGARQFGWVIGPAPFENFITPGNRIVHVLVLVPKTHSENQVTMTVSYCWPQRELRHHWPWTSYSDNCRDVLREQKDNKDDRKVAGATRTAVQTEQSELEKDIESRQGWMAISLPDRPHLEVTKLSYVPAEAKELPGAAAPTQPENDYVLVSFKDPIDPNLVITAGSKIINRVRDVRGRGIFGATAEKVAGAETEQTAVSASRFGFLEKDRVDPDTWLQTSSNSLVMEISRGTAGTDVFPVITFSAPGAASGELTHLLVPTAEVRVGEWKFKGDHLPMSAFQPLFTQKYEPGRINIYVDEIGPEAQTGLQTPTGSKEDGKEYPRRIQIVSETIREGQNRPLWLHEAAQVVLAVKAHHGTKHPSSDLGWPLACDASEGTINCEVTKRQVSEIRSAYGGSFPKDLKIWLDEPPYFGRPGLWADHDISASANKSEDEKKEDEKRKGDNEKSQRTTVASAVYPPIPGKPAAEAVPPFLVSDAKTSSSDSKTSNPERTWNKEAYPIGDWSEVHEAICIKCKKLKNLEQNHWEATIKLKNLDALASAKKQKTPATDPAQPAPYCIRGLEEINQQIDALKERAEKLRNLYTQKGVPSDIQGLKADSDTRHWVKEQAKSSAEEFEEKENQKITAKYDKDDDSITISVPFVALPAVTDRLRLQYGTCDTYAPTAKTVLLPELASKLEPGPVVVTDLGNGYYRLSGQRLRAVDEVRLEGNGQIIIRKASSSLNSADFPATVDGKALSKGDYVLFAVIETMTIPLQSEDANKKLQPATIKVPDPKASQPKNDTTDSQETAHFSLKINAESDGSASKAPASANKKAKAGTGSGGGTTSGADTGKK